MSLDAYQPCPCGIDKKIKFCCGPEILDDLAKIDEALAGEQRLGALDLCNRLLEKKPDRPCLLMHKATVQMALHELEASGQIPLAVHGMTGLVSAPAESPLKAAAIAEFNEALKQADLGCWRLAASKFEALSKKEPNEPAIWRNLGVCRLRVVDN